MFANLGSCTVMSKGVKHRLHSSFPDIVGAEVIVVLRMKKRKRNTKAKEGWKKKRNQSLVQKRFEKTNHLKKQKNTNEEKKAGIRLFA